MDPDEITAIRGRIKERLQNNPLCDTEPVKITEGHGIPFGWIIFVLTMVAILATLRDW